MWNVTGTSISPNWLTLQPVVVLYEYDGPKIFTCKDTAENIYLAYFCDEDANATRFLVVSFSNELFEQLIRGDINVHDALSRRRAWIFDLDNDCNSVRAWRIDVDDLPAGVLPEPGVMLYRHLPSRANLPITRAASGETDLPPLIIATPAPTANQLVSHA